MPIELDSGEFGSDSEVDSVVEEMFRPPQQQNRTTIDSRMAEMEERLETIQYYKTLLNGGFFTDPPNPEIAAKIEAEVATFVLGRLDALLNMGSSSTQTPVARNPFTEEEITALKSLAEPETHKVLTSVVSKVFTKIKNPSTTQEPPKEKPQPKLAAKKLAPEIKKVVAQKPKNAAKPSPTESNTEVVEGGKKYKIHIREDGKRVKMDITPQARPTGAIQPIPMPKTKRELEMQMEVSARQAVDFNAGLFDQKLNQR